MSGQKLVRILYPTGQFEAYTRFCEQVELRQFWCKLIGNLNIPSLSTWKVRKSQKMTKENRGGKIWIGIYDQTKVKQRKNKKHILCMIAQTVRKLRIPMLTDVLKLMFICSKFNICLNFVVKKSAQFDEQIHWPATIRYDMRK